MQEHGLSERGARRTVNLNRCTFRYEARKVEAPRIAEELCQLAERFLSICSASPRNACLLELHTRSGARTI